MIRAYRKHVIVIPDKVKGRDKTTESGIIYKEAERERRSGDLVYLATGTVHAVGDECDPTFIKDCKKGTKIGYNPYDAFYIEVDGKVFEAVRDNSIMCYL